MPSSSLEADDDGVTITADGRYEVTYAVSVSSSAAAVLDVWVNNVASVSTPVIPQSHSYVSLAAGAVSNVSNDFFVTLPEDAELRLYLMADAAATLTLQPYGATMTVKGIPADK